MRQVLLCAYVPLALASPGALLAQATTAGATGELLIVEENLTAANVQLLRSRGIQPYTRDVESLAKGITDLKQAGRLSPSSAAGVSALLSPTPGHEPSPTEIEQALEDLDAAGFPKKLFEELSNVLTDEELAAILRGASGFEVPDPQQLEQLLGRVEVTELMREIADWITDQGQVVEGTEVPSKMPFPITTSELAQRPGVWGSTTNVETIEACSKVASDFNRALAEAAAKQFDVNAQLQRIELGKKVDSTCFRSVPTPIPMELETFGLLEYPGGALNCAAVMTNTNTVVTARHCLFDDRTGGPQVIKWSFIHFRPWLDPAKRIPLHAVRVPEGVPSNFSDQFLAIHDVAEATLQEAIAGAPPVCWASATAGEPLGLFGYLPEATAPVGSDWSARLRLSVGGTCMAQQNSDTCFVHFCNAVPGFSGSPLFGSQDGSCPNGVRVLGLHLAASGKSPGCATLGGNDAVAGSQVAKLLNLQP